MIFDVVVGIGLYPDFITSLITVSSKYSHNRVSSRPKGYLELFTDELSLFVGKAPEILPIKGVKSFDLFPYQIDDISAGNKVVCILYASSVPTDFRGSSGSVPCKAHH